MRLSVYLASSILGLLVFGMIFFRLKDYMIRRKRKEDKKENFLIYFVDKGISEPLVLSVYQYLQNWMSLSDFPVRPKDNIADVYGIVDEDLDDLIIEVAEINNFEIPANTNYWQEPVITVEDLILFIVSFPKKKFTNEDC